MNVIDARVTIPGHGRIAGMTDEDLRAALGVTVNLSARGGFGWSCQCGGDSLSLLRGSAADFTVRCGCGKIYRARLEEVKDGNTRTAR